MLQSFVISILVDPVCLWFLVNILTLRPLSQFRTTLTLDSSEGFPSLSHNCTLSGIGILVSLYTDSGYENIRKRNLSDITELIIEH